MQQVSKFAVFGFNTNNQDITNSEICVTINYSILTGALICLQCDVSVSESQLIFTANGVYISALILKSLNYVKIAKTNISYRFSSNYSSGLINQVYLLSKFEISTSVLTGYNFITSSFNGYLCSKLYDDISITVTSLQVCVLNTANFGDSTFKATLTDIEIITCSNICPSQQYVTYGICRSKLPFSSIVNDVVECTFPFIFNTQNETCYCDFGYYINNSYCVNVIDQFSTIQKNATMMQNELDYQIQLTEMQLKTAIVDLQLLIQTNISELKDTIHENNNLTNNNIISTNVSLHQNINMLRAKNAQQFDDIYKQQENNYLLQKDQITQARADISSTNQTLNFRSNSTDQLINQVAEDLSNINITTKVQFNSLNTTISARFDTVDTSLVTTNTKLSDLKTIIATRFDTVDTSLTNINTKMSDLKTTVNTRLDTVDTSLSNTITKLIDIKTTITSRFDTVDTSLITTNTKLSDLKTTVVTRFDTVDTSLTNTNTKLIDLKTQITSISTQISNNVATQTQISSTQTQITNVYNGLLTAIANAQDPCKAWPGSVNEAGICKCDYGNPTSVYKGYCPSFNRCCEYQYIPSSGNQYKYTCYGMATQTLTNECPGLRIYTNVAL
ncbi:BspA_family leucine-rich repeat surface protein [Hexamita inflata]|uniref:BspA family leucine-rich repeat surface protein n=1 Tax=Hexamita inflata TaxID=28002 RepID=A0AA86P7D6_9EUKA|nr:BspA family leucine-rich repeat surface protein [Hexamita inflata]